MAYLWTAASSTPRKLRLRVPLVNSKILNLVYSKTIMWAYNQIIIVDITNLISRILKLLIKCNTHTSKVSSTHNRHKCSPKTTLASSFPRVSSTNKCKASPTWIWISKCKWISLTSRFTTLVFTRPKECIRMLTSSKCKCSSSNTSKCTNMPNTTSQTQRWTTK